MSTLKRLLGACCLLAVCVIVARAAPVGVSTGTGGGGVGVSTGSVNRAPIVQAGPNQILIWPSSMTWLNGQVMDDGLPNPPGRVTTQWSVLGSSASNGAGVIIVSPANLRTPLIITRSGTFTLLLTAFDGALYSGTAVVVQVVASTVPRVNHSPVVKAGSNRTVDWPSPVQLQGSVSDDGLPNPPGRLLTWWEVLGSSVSTSSGTVTFSNPMSVNSSVKFATPGIYTLVLKAYDGALVGSGQVVINARSPQPPLRSDNLLLPGTSNKISPATGGEGKVICQLPESGHLIIRIYDRSGRLVRELANADAPAGINKQVWDGRDAGGKLCPTGIYQAKIILNGKVVKQLQFVVVR